MYFKLEYIKIISSICSSSKVPLQIPRNYNRDHMVKGATVGMVVVGSGQRGLGGGGVSMV